MPIDSGSSDIREVVCEDIFSKIDQTQDVSTSTVLENVLLCGNESANGYAIPSEAFGGSDGAKRLYENVHVYLDHDTKNPANRKISELAGMITGVEMVDGRPRGRIQTINNEAGRMLRELYAMKIPNVGLSHAAIYEFDKSRKIVRSIKRVLSVDVVTRPATTKTFVEQEQNVELQEALNKINELTIQNSDLTSKLTATESKLVDLDRKLAEVNVERDTLKSQVDEINAQKALEQRKVDIATELVANGLNIEETDFVTPVFVESLMKLATPEERAPLIADRASIIKSAKPSKAGTVSRTGTGTVEKPESITESLLDNPNLFIR